MQSRTDFAKNKHSETELPIQLTPRRSFQDIGLIAGKSLKFRARVKSLRRKLLLKSRSKSALRQSSPTEQLQLATGTKK